MLSRVNLNRLAYFAAVVDHGSFTGAARSLGVAKAVVSHQVAQLEEELGVVLLERTTRRVSLTEAGRVFEQRSRDILQLADAAVRSVREEPKEVSGTLRIGALDGYAQIVLREPIARFLQAYPNCRVELIVSGHAPAPEDGLDLTIRPGDPDSPPEGTQVGRPHPLIIVAAPRLVEGLMLDRPEQLRDLPMISKSPSHSPPRLTFRRGTEVVVLPTSPRLRLSSGAVMLDYLVAGLGAGVVPDCLVASELADGRLVRVLPDWELQRMAHYAAVPAGRPVPPRVTAFLSLLEEAA